MTVAARKPKTWADFHIVLPQGATGEIDTTCPQCSHERKKKNAKCLSVNIEQGRFLCHHCAWSGSLTSGASAGDYGHWRRPVYRKPERDLPPLKTGSRVTKWFLDKRKITAETLARFDISEAVVYMPDIERHANSICFPYFRNGELINVKYRDGKKNMRMETKCERILYGLDYIGENTTLIWVEGEIDFLSVQQCGINAAVVSVPDGAPPPEAKNYASKFTFLESAEPWLKNIKTHIIAADNDEPGKKLRDELSRRLGVERCKHVVWPDGCSDPNAVLVEHGEEKLRECLSSAEPAPVNGLYDARHFYQRVVDIYDNGLQPGLSTGWKSLDELYTVRPGEYTLVTGIPHAGKALALDTPIPTPDGFTMMGDLKAGDTVFDENGKPCTVLAAHDVMYDHDCYDVRFSDGSSIIADAEHLWFTRTEKARISERNKQAKAKSRKTKHRKGIDQSHKKTFPGLVTTQEIAETLTVENNGKPRANHAIALTGALDLPERDLPIHPYMLGVWLGDGESSAGRYYSPDPEITERLRTLGYEITKSENRKLAHGVKGLIALLKKTGLLNNKHIPMEYLRGSIEQRRELLAGLMDTDGYVSPVGHCEYTSINERLAEGVRQLALTLGYRATLNAGIATIDGEYKGPKYRVIFTPGEPVCFLPRKRERCGTSGMKFPYRKIVACEPVESVPVRCIRVSSESNLFLAGKECVPTHNTPWLDALLVNLAEMHGMGFVYFSAENGSVQRHISRQIARYLKKPFDENSIASRMTREEMEKGARWVNQHFSWILGDECEEESDEISMTLERILDLCKVSVFRKGVNGVVIDPWNTIEHYRPANLSETEYISKQLGKIDRFCKRMDVHLWLVAHPTKLKKLGDGTYPVPTPYDVAGSSHFRNKPPNCITVHRDQNNRSAATEIHVQKVKFDEIGRVGTTSLYYDIPTGRFGDTMHFRTVENRETNVLGTGDD